MLDAELEKIVPLVSIENSAEYTKFAEEIFRYDHDVSYKMNVKRGL